MGIQTSSLRLGVDSQGMVTGAAKGEKALDGLKDKTITVDKQFDKLEDSMRDFGRTADDSTRLPKINKGLDNVSDELIDTRREAEKTGDQFRKLGREADVFGDILAGISVGAIVAEFSSLLDVTSQIDSNIKLVTNTTDDLNAVYDELFRVSNKTFSSLETNAQVFNRLSNATKDLGLSYGDVINITEDLNKLLKINGATAAETSSVLIQLAQGLGAGALQGDEFRSIAEALPQVLDLVVDELNRTSGGAKITRAELKNLASEGKITAPILVNAFKNASDQIDEQFKSITPTIEGAFQVLKNNLTNFVRDVNSASGIAGIFSNAILLVSNNIETLAGAILGLTTILTAKLVASIGLATKALLATPIGRIAAAFVAATTAIGTFGSKSVTVAGETATVWEVTRAVFATIGDLIEIVAGKFSAFFEAVKNNQAFQFAINSVAKFGDMLASVISFGVKGWQFFVNTSINLVRALFTTIGGYLMALPDLFQFAFESALNKIIAPAKQMAKLVGTIFGSDTIKSLGEFEVNTSKSLDNVKNEFFKIRDDVKDILGADNFKAFEDALNKLGDNVLPLFSDNIKEVTKETKANAQAVDLLSGSWGNATKSVKVAGDAANDAGATFGSITQDLKQQNDVLRLTGIAADQLAAKYRAQAILKSELDPLEKAFLDNLVKTNVELTRQKNLLDQIIGPGQNLQAEIIALDQLYKDGKISISQFNQEMEKLNLMKIQMDVDAGEGGFADGFLLELDRMTEGLNNWKVEAGALTGAFINDFSTGFGNAIGDAIWGAEDLGESLKAVARDAISQLVSSMIQVGVQMIANKALETSLRTASTAESAASAAVVTAAWAPAATVASIGTFGGAAAIGLGAVLGALAATAFKDGGYVSGAGGRRSDSMLARLSNGEFVVNAAATYKNRGLLEEINRGGTPTGMGGTVVMNITTQNADSFEQSQSQILNRQQIALERAARRNR